MLERLESLLECWQEASAQGRDLSPEELCPDDPVLAGELAYQIGVLRQMKQLASGLGEPTVPRRRPWALPGK
jgi:hypothetical protein